MALGGDLAVMGSREMGHQLEGTWRLGAAMPMPCSDLPARKELMSPEECSQPTASTCSTLEPGIHPSRASPASDKAGWGYWTRPLLP